MGKTVLLLSHMFENVTGGAGTYVNYLHKAFIGKRDINFIILTPDIEMSLDGIIKVDGGENFYDLLPKFREKVDRIAQEEKRIIVHGNTATELSYFLDSPYKLIANINDYEVALAYNLIPLYCRLYGTSSVRKIMGKIKARKFEERVVERADYVVCNSDFTLDKVSKTYKMSGKLIRIHKSVSNVECHFSEVNFSSGKFIFVGKDWQKKGLALCLKALGDLKYNNPYYSFEMNIVGPNYSERRYILQLARGHGIEDNIVYHGPLSMPEVRTLYSKCNLFILPTYIEAFGISYLEAMSSGCVVIGSCVGGVPEIIVNKKNGFLMKTKSHKELSYLIAKATYLSDRQLTSLYSEARDTTERFSSDVMIADIIKMYDSINFV